VQLRQSDVEGGGERNRYSAIGMGQRGKSKTGAGGESKARTWYTQFKGADPSNGG